MWLLTLLAGLSLVGVGVSFALYALTRQPRFLAFAWRIVRYGVLFALIVFAVMILERVILIL
ncbi:hypothetical protein [Dechloromonas sp. ZS-1]|uniref:hypothetical protein n=1 Tax=Dechloromonas sp. ZS-1 TaxID=3138067 RepID=UPI0031FBF83E